MRFDLYGSFELICVDIFDPYGSPGLPETNTSDISLSNSTFTISGKEYDFFSDNVFILVCFFKFIFTVFKNYKTIFSVQIFSPTPIFTV